MSHLDEIERLRKELASCQRERDAWKQRAELYRSWLWSEYLNAGVSTCLASAAHLQGDKWRVSCAKHPEFDCVETRGYAYAEDCAVMHNIQEIRSGSARLVQEGTAEAERDRLRGALEKAEKALEAHDGCGPNDGCSDCDAFRALLGGAK